MKMISAKPILVMDVLNHLRAYRDVSKLVDGRVMTANAPAAGLVKFKNNTSCI